MKAVRKFVHFCGTHCRNTLDANERTNRPTQQSQHSSAASVQLSNVINKSFILFIYVLLSCGTFSLLPSAMCVCMRTNEYALFCWSLATCNDLAPHGLMAHEIERNTRCGRTLMNSIFIFVLWPSSLNWHSRRRGSDYCGLLARKDDACSKIGR